MKRFVIERHIPGVGHLNAAQYKELAATSNAAVAKLAGQVQWMHSHIAADNTFCVYLGLSEDLIREHSRLAGDALPGRRLSPDLQVLPQPLYSHSAATFCAAPMFAFTTTLIASSTRSLA